MTGRVDGARSARSRLVVVLMSVPCTAHTTWQGASASATRTGTKVLHSPSSRLHHRACRRSMSSKALRCRIGLHSWVKGHPPDEREQRRADWVCWRCRKTRSGAEKIPYGMLGG